MTVETATYISQLNATYPAATDAKSEGDDHMRLIKSVVKSTFPNLTAAACTPTTTELNYVTGVSSAIQTQLDAKVDATTVNAAVAIANYKGLWSSLTGALAMPASVSHSGSIWLLNANLADVTAATPGVSASWTLSSGVGDHEVIVTTGNGHGSSNPSIRRFTTTKSSAGTAITYADSATLGASFTINSAGIYAIGCADNYSALVEPFGASVNSTQLASAIQAITAANRLGMAYAVAAGTSNTLALVAKLSAGDVVRPHDGGQNNDTTATGSYFSIRKIGT